MTTADASDHTTTENDAMDVLTATGLKHEIKREIERMPPRRRDVVEFAVALNADLGEVVEVLGLSPQTVIVHLTRAGRDLKHGLRHWHPDRQLLDLRDVDPPAR